jgi:uncharacterized protein YegP (UPF0339 family)
MTNYKIETYRDATGEHRWRCRATNGRIVATSGEGYGNKQDMLDTIANLQLGFQQAKVVEVEA